MRDRNNTEVVVVVAVVVRVTGLVMVQAKVRGTLGICGVDGVVSMHT